MCNAVKVIIELLDFVMVLIQGYLLQYYMGSFLEARGKSRYGGLYLAVLYTLIQKGLGILWSPEYGRVWVLAKQAVSFLLLVALILCFYRAFRPITIFLTVSFQAVKDISIYITIILLDKPSDLVFDLWDWYAGKGIIDSILTWSRAVNVSVVGIQILRILFLLLLTGICLKSIVKNFREKDYRMHKNELLFILIPSLTGLVLCMLLRIIMVTIEQNMTVFLYKKYPSLTFLLPGVLLLSLLSILQGVKSFQEMVSLNREKNSRMILEKQLTGMQEQIHELERVYSGVRSMKHDMRNTLAIVSGLAAGETGEGQQENEVLKSYLTDLNETINQMELSFHTGNAIADALLHMKYCEAAESIPDLRLDTEQLFFPKDLSIRSYDTGIILGNALDNALEACVKLKKQEPETEAFIRLISFQKGKLFFLRIENSFDGTFIRKPQEEFPMTDKEEKELHGIGLRNIKHVAESYEGTVDWTVEDRVFTLAVMLKIP